MLSSTSPPLLAPASPAGSILQAGGAQGMFCGHVCVSTCALGSAAIFGRSGINAECPLAGSDQCAGMSDPEPRRGDAQLQVLGSDKRVRCRKRLDSSFTTASAPTCALIVAPAW